MVNNITEKLLACKAIEFGDFTLASGAKSPYYVDIKTAATDPDLLKSIAEIITRSESFDMVAGVAVGGVPLAVAVALEAKKPYAIIRAAVKDHGKNKVIIGNVAGKKVLLVEDVTTTGGSALHGIESLRAAGALADRVVTFVDREEGAETMLIKHGISLIPLVRAREIIKK